VNGGWLATAGEGTYSIGGDAGSLIRGTAIRTAASVVGAVIDRPVGGRDRTASYPNDRPGRMDSLAQLLARPSLPLGLVEQPILLRGRQRGDRCVMRETENFPSAGNLECPAYCGSIGAGLIRRALPGWILVTSQRARGDARRRPTNRRPTKRMRAQEGRDWRRSRISAHNRNRPAARAEPRQL